MEDFRGDYEQLAAVMRSSWADSAGAPYLYTPQLLADLLRYPGASHSLAPALYSGSELIAFAAGLPRLVEIAGTSWRVLIATLVTVASGHKQSGCGTAVWSELIDRARRAGYDGVITYCGDGQPMQRIVEASGARLGLPPARLRSFHHLIGGISLDAGGRGEHVVDVDAAALLEAAARQPRPADAIWRVWTEPEAEWQLTRVGAVAAAAAGSALTGSVVTVADATRSRYLVIDDVLWGDGDDGARRLLLGELLGRAAREGARFAVVPLLGYADLRPLVSSGFMPSPYLMQAYLTVCSGRATPPATDTLYLDVI